MNPGYFYLDIELSEGEVSALSVRQLVQSAASALFGSCGGAALVVDVLRAGDGRALLRVPAGELRRLRAALALAPSTVRVRQAAPSLQALI